MNTDPRDERKEAPEDIWCANCGNRVYQSGGKWFHSSTGGMPCNIPAHAIPSSENAATRMRDLCVAKVRRVLVGHDKGASGEHCGDFMTCDCGAAFDKAEFITALESLTLDSAQKEQEGKNDGK